MKLNLTLNQIRKLRNRGNLVPLYAEIVADTETPVSLFKKITRDQPYSFLLESAAGPEKIARYSFIIFDPEKVIKFPSEQRKNSPYRPFQAAERQTNPLKTLEKELRKFKPVPLPDLPRFLGGLTGYFNYEAVRHFEKTVPIRPQNLIPEGIFTLNRTLVILDHFKHQILVVTQVKIDSRLEENFRKAVLKIRKIVEKIQKRPTRIPLLFFKKNGSKLKSNHKKTDFEKMVKEAKKLIKKGEIFQVVLSQRFEAKLKTKPFNLYRALRIINPSPYLFYLNFGDFQIIGASPELLVRVENREIMVCPIAGTRPRGKNGTEEKRLEKELLSDPKELAEHQMLVDLGRNDLGQVAEIGSLKVENLKHLEKYSHVMHLVSGLKGKLDLRKTIFDAFKSGFPAGTLTGAPKIRAMQIISDLEKEARGIYGGAIGYFSFSGNMDFAIAIRTMLVFEKKVYFQVGAGIVYDSVPRREFKETINKARANLKALQYSTPKRLPANPSAGRGNPSHKQTDHAYQQAD